MIIALVIFDRTQPRLQDKPPCLAPWGDESMLEHLISTILRGPFGGTVVALHPDFTRAAQEQLRGFALQSIAIKSFADGPHSALREGLTAATALRERWEKAMAVAASRFHDSGGGKSRGAANDKNTLSAHRGSKDVKIRGLARSFDRDGVMLFRGDYPAMSLELQAQVVEAFGREGADKGSAARPFAQAVHQGSRGYPLILSVEAAREVAALPASTGFDAWLLKNVERVQDVNCEAWGASAVLHSAEDYEAIRRRMKI